MKIPVRVLCQTKVTPRTREANESTGGDLPWQDVRTERYRPNELDQY